MGLSETKNGKARSCVLCSNTHLLALLLELVKPIKIEHIRNCIGKPTHPRFSIKRLLRKHILRNHLFLLPLSTTLTPCLATGGRTPSMRRQGRTARCRAFKTPIARTLGMTGTRPGYGIGTGGSGGVGITLVFGVGGRGDVSGTPGRGSGTTSAGGGGRGVVWRLKGILVEEILVTVGVGGFHGSGFYGGYRDSVTCDAVIIMIESGNRLQHILLILIKLHTMHIILAAIILGIIKIEVT
mmetsp:Transcript_7504/g.13504  ORF Transcript_7504/g.13504 Transcript_7504/m.13504 type:complete len:240 (+) Transcript_7504:441-1160(+)